MMGVEMSRRNQEMKNQRGMATVEAITLLGIFLMLMGYTLGFFGIIHSGILNSIGARTYAFEIFRHRTNINYFRGNTNENKYHFTNYGVRYHAVVSEKTPDGVLQFFATERPLTFGFSSPSEERTVDTHNVSVPNISLEDRNEAIGVSPVWLMIQYGICMNVQCGD